MVRPLLANQVAVRRPESDQERDLAPQVTTALWRPYHFQESLNGSGREGMGR
jgi:hypothetical protein